MDESSQARKPRNSNAIITVINMGAMVAGIAAAVIAANKGKSASADASKIEKSMSELNSKFDKISEQLKGIQPKMEVSSVTARESEKKPNGAPQQSKPQDIIYVRKSSEFSFYN